MLKIQRTAGIPAAATCTAAAAPGVTKRDDSVVANLPSYYGTPETLFSQLAALADQAIAVLDAAIDDPEADWLTSAARTLVAQIGWTADLGSRQCGSPGQKDLTNWLLPPLCQPREDQQ